MSLGDTKGAGLAHLLRVGSILTTKNKPLNMKNENRPSWGVALKIFGNWQENFQI